MEIYWILGAAFVVALFFFFSIIVGTVGKRAKQENGVVEEARPDVLCIVRDAYVSLTRQKAAGYGPWLSACLSRPETPPGVALEALRRVRSELTGRRFNLDGVNMAIVTLEEMTGEWG